MNGHLSWQSVRRVELIATVILSFAILLTAWSTFQSAIWSSLQHVAFSEADAARTMAARFGSLVDEQAALHTAIFIAWAEAVGSEISSGDLKARGYTAKPDTLSSYLFARFPKELKRATRAWLERRPFQSADAPATPFEMPEYHLEALDQVKRLNAQAEALTHQARECSARSSRYGATSLLFALALFLAGVGVKLTTPSVQRVMLGLAAVLLLTGVGILATFPVAFGGTFAPGS